MNNATHWTTKLNNAEAELAKYTAWHVSIPVREPLINLAKRDIQIAKSKLADILAREQARAIAETLNSLPWYKRLLA